MALFASITEVTQASPSLRALKRERSEFAFGVLVLIVLIGLAIASVAFGVAPLEDPTIMILAAP
jgi:hypothetical protein